MKEIVKYVDCGFKVRLGKWDRERKKSVVVRIMFLSLDYLCYLEN